MRGWKAISFEFLKSECLHKSYRNHVGEWCKYNGSAGHSGCLCSISNCPIWKMLGRADIKVVKITSSNKPMPTLSETVKEVKRWLNARSEHPTGGITTIDIIEHTHEFIERITSA